MTRYLCAHPGHDRKGRHQAVDVTAQVRLEREFLPRESSYLASTDDVIARVVALRSGDSVDRLACSPPAPLTACPGCTSSTSCDEATARSLP
jgi:hypothetical protein